MWPLSPYTCGSQFVDPLTQILSGTTYYSILDLKDLILNHSALDSFPSIVIEDLTHRATQFTWTVLSQGSRENPHLFWQELVKPPYNLLITLTDDLFLCRLSEQGVSRGTETIFNLPVIRRYRLSREGWSCPLWVTHVWMIHDEKVQTRLWTDSAFSDPSPPSDC